MFRHFDYCPRVGPDSTYNNLAQVPILVPLFYAFYL